MVLKGLENHRILCRYVDEVEKGIRENDAETTLLRLRMCLDYIVCTYCKKCFLCTGVNILKIEGRLLDRINFLARNEMISEEEAQLLHQMRMKDVYYREYVTRFTSDELLKDSDIMDKLRENYRELLMYLPRFLNVFPHPFAV